MSAGSGVSIDLQPHPSDADLARVLAGVRAFNRAAAGHEPPRPAACFLRTADGTIVGGAHGTLWQRSLHVAALWVDESLRGSGHGAALLRRLEEYAAQSGARLAYVETLSYQARPFYERQGYRLFGELEGVADGCAIFFLSKPLPESARDSGGEPDP